MSRERPHLSFSLKLVSSEKTYDYPQQSWQFQSHYSLRDYTGVYFIKLIPCTADAVSFFHFYFESSLSFSCLIFGSPNSLVQHKLKQLVLVVSCCCKRLARTNATSANFMQLFSLILCFFSDGHLTCKFVLLRSILFLIYSASIFHACLKNY